MYMYIYNCFWVATPSISQDIPGFVLRGEPRQNAICSAGNGIRSAVLGKHHITLCTIFPMSLIIFKNSVDYSLELGLLTPDSAVGL